MSLLSTQPYKGSRDFYPEEMRSRSWMFQQLRKTVVSFGFEEIDAPILEPIEIYLAKTSEEIVSQQIYSFEDRGGRKVAIRPELTPTVSRMIAKKLRELPKPIRWFSIPNLWRYEQPGKGRLREHWQLNCDIFAAGNEFLADVEILLLAVSLLNNFGADQRHFSLKINHRQILTGFFEDVLKIDSAQNAPLARILDKRAKISDAEYHNMIRGLGLSTEQGQIIDQYMAQGLTFCNQHPDLRNNPGVIYMNKMLSMLEKIGCSLYIHFDQTIVRGFDYYTGLVFEVFDNHPENNRSLFGGGRYNNLVGNFVKESADAVGFGMGDVTLVEFLKTHNLYREFPRQSQVFIVNMAGPDEIELQIQLFELAQNLRRLGFLVEQSLVEHKLGRQLQDCEARGIPLAIIAGSTEFAKNTVLIKDIKSRKQEEISMDEIPKRLDSLLAISQ